MRDAAAELARLFGAGRPFAMATVVAVNGSAPRGPGAVLAVDADGRAVGSVSGGCVESSVYELCRTALAGGEPVLERFGYDPDDPFAVGLSCGGDLDVYVTRVDPRTDAATGHALSAVAAGEVVQLDSSVRRQRPDLDAIAAAYPPPPRLLVYGAVDHAAAVVRAGRLLGNRVTVCDAREVFATPVRFPDADEVIVSWPHRHLAQVAASLGPDTAICVLTHDAKFDVPLLKLALTLPVAHVGAMGSRRTHRERLVRLREAGVTEAQLARLRSPIGLDLGGRSPEETAIAIAAEIIADRHGAGAGRLSQVDVPIHRVA